MRLPNIKIVNSNVEFVHYFNGRLTTVKIVNDELENVFNSLNAFLQSGSRARSPSRSTASAWHDLLQTSGRRVEPGRG